MGLQTLDFAILPLSPHFIGTDGPTVSFTGSSKLTSGQCLQSLYCNFFSLSGAQVNSHEYFSRPCTLMPWASQSGANAFCLCTVVYLKSFHKEAGNGTNSMLLSVSTLIRRPSSTLTLRHPFPPLCFFPLQHPHSIPSLLLCFFQLPRTHSLPLSPLY